MDGENLFKKLWKNPRTKAGLKLIFWLIAIFAVVLILSIIPENKPASKEPSPNASNQTETKDFKAMQEELLQNNYEYYYDIVTNNLVFKYHGRKAENKEIGFKETVDETIKYYVVNGKNYQVNIDKISENDKIFGIINQDFINLEYIFNIVNNLKAIKDSGKYTYQTMLNGKEYTIEIITSNHNITNINISSDLEIYKLTFLNHLKNTISSPSDSL